MEFKKLDLLIDQAGKAGLTERYGNLNKNLKRIMNQLIDDGETDDASIISDAVILVNDVIDCINKNNQNN
jgi:hypothetical protein